MKLRVTAHYYDASIDDEDQRYQTVELDGPETEKDIETLSGFSDNIDSLQDEHGAIDCGGDAEWFELGLPDERDSKKEAEAACSGLMNAVCAILGIEVK